MFSTQNLNTKKLFLKYFFNYKILKYFLYFLLERSVTLECFLSTVHINLLSFVFIQQFAQIHSSWTTTTANSFTLRSYCFTRFFCLVYSFTPVYSHLQNVSIETDIALFFFLFLFVLFSFYSFAPVNTILSFRIFCSSIRTHSFARIIHRLRVF